MLDLIIKNGQCYINGNLEDKDIAVKDGKILKIGDISEETKDVYEFLKNQDIGDYIGKLENNKLVKKSLKK